LIHQIRSKFLALNTEFVKKHWAILGGGLVGLFVLYYLFKSAGHGQSSSGDMSGAGTALQTMDAAASLQNAQTNSQITMSAYNAGVANNQIAASLQASLANTAAGAAVEQQRIGAQLVAATGEQQAQVTIQQVQSDAAIQQTQIASTTAIEQYHTMKDYGLGVAKLQSDVALGQVANQAAFQKGIISIAKYSNRKANNVATIISSLLGQGPAAIGANHGTGFSLAVPGLFTVGVQS
jgi:hypothetical protein